MVGVTPMMVVPHRVATVKQVQQLILQADLQALLHLAHLGQMPQVQQALLIQMVA